LETPVTRNNILASNLYFITVGLGVINIFLDRAEFNNAKTLVVTFIGIGINVGISILIRKNYAWVKWVLLVLIIIGFIGMVLTVFPTLFDTGVIIGLITIAIFVLQTIAAILLFIKPIIRVTE